KALVLPILIEIFLKASPDLHDTARTSGGRGGRAVPTTHGVMSAADPPPNWRGSLRCAALLPTPVLAEIVVHRGIALQMPDNALFVPPLVEDSVQEGENLAPRRLGLDGAVAPWHSVVQEAMGCLSINADVKTLLGSGQHVAHAQNVV